MQVHLIHFTGIFSFEFLSIQFADIYTYIQTFESVLSSMCIKIGSGLLITKRNKLLFW